MCRAEYILEGELGLDMERSFNTLRICNVCRNSHPYNSVSKTIQVERGHTFDPVELQLIIEWIYWFW